MFSALPLASPWFLHRWAKREEMLEQAARQALFSNTMFSTASSAVEPSIKGAQPHVWLAQPQEVEEERQQGPMMGSKSCNHLGLGRRCWCEGQALTLPGTISVSAHTFGFQSRSNVWTSSLTGMSDPCTKKLYNPALYDELVARRSRVYPT